jgi:nucleoside-diphosphate-sugar epimerase
MKSKKKYLITGGSGFIGSALVKRLVEEGNNVRVFDNNSRGNLRRINDIIENIEFIKGDIRNKEIVEEACKGIDCCCHLAYVNGTEYFYKMPEFVLDVAIKGVMNVLDGCILHNVPELIMASSSEVYQNASTVPTDENVSLVVPDVFNPRYSYGGGKILSELVAVNYGKKHFNHVVIFRPHNVYGPDMGWEHVIPQFVLRMNDLCRATSGIVKFPIQGTGKETRACVYIDDFTNGLMKVIEQGEHLNVYHIGTNEEVSIEQLAKEVAVRFEREIKILPGVPMKGSALRRCPDISKLRKLGYEPKVEIKDGLRLTTEWYIENSNLKP